MCYYTIMEHLKRKLIHICCAPDATVALDGDSRDGNAVCYFCNPNIQPAEEHRKRLGEMKKLAGLLQVPFIWDESGADSWREAVRGLEGEPEGGRRCEACFRVRLERTARFARDHGFDAITTVLTVSPHKDARLINAIGREACARYGVVYIDSDLKKNGGFKRSVELSRKYGLYRQDYCGCAYSRDMRRKPSRPKGSAGSFSYAPLP